MKTESLIFDMDGTLWDSAANVAASWNETLKNVPDVNIKFTEQDIKGIMGLTMDVIAAKFFGEKDPKRRMELMDMCGSEENEYLRIHGGRLYDKLEETLETLSKKHRLFIVSNCQSGYIEAFLEHYSLGKYFTDHICWGDNELPKGKNIRLIMDRNSITDGTYVGDTQGDCDSAYFAGAKFIHAAYGFGTADRSDGVIYNFYELAEMF